MNLGGSRDQAQIQAKGCDPLNRPKEPQSRVPRKIRARFVQIWTTARYETQPNCRDAPDARRRNHCRNHDRDGLAAAFRSRLSCRRRPQETWVQPCFRTNRQGSCLSHQGWQSFAGRCRPDQTGGLMRCRRKVVTVVPRPERPLKMRSRICAVSISGDYAHDGRVSFRGRPLLI